MVLPKPVKGMIFWISWVMCGLLLLAMHYGWRQMRNGPNGRTVIEVGSTLVAVTENVLAAKPKYRIGIQAGHWKNNELPDEFSRLRIAGTGTSAAGYNEWE